MPSRRSVLVCASAFGATILALSHCSLDGLSGGPIADAGDTGADARTDVDVSSDAGLDAHLVSDAFLGRGDGSHDCSLHADGKLYCQNSPYTDLHAQPTKASPIVDHLISIDSKFDCWGTGDLHDGGNTTWYRAVGDEHQLQGWAAGRDVSTASFFDQNPAAFGFATCM